MTEVAVRDAATIESIVARAARGDEAAFARLVADHHASMARVAYAITGDAESAADAVQTAWTTAWRRLRSLRDTSAVRAWLVAIAANEARQVLRRQRRRTVVDLSSVADLACGSDPGDRILV
jgi:RNA polymerase sigma factor (sigma-70 family)